jgi:hypothetical protein
MNAGAALKAARDAGIHIRIDDDDLMLEASEEPSTAVLTLLSRHKAGILVLLRAAEHGWSTEDWQVFFDERAGMVEFEDGLTRAQAEARAFACCVSEWLNRNPARSPAGRCAGCSGGDRPGDPLLPFGTEATGDTWLHSACWFAWYAGREAEAVAALSAMGIVASPILKKRERDCPTTSPIGLTRYTYDRSVGRRACGTVEGEVG